MSTRRTVPLKPSMFARAGKIRLGVKVPSSRAGVLFPKATDYFVVVADESGITSPAAAAAFHEVYGDEPRELRVQLPAHAPDDVMEAAWRLYGTGKLKRRCDGDTCDVRRATGGWDERPCACKADEIPEVVLKNGQQQRNPQHCTLSWTMQVILPEVMGVGVWTLTSTSVIGRDAVTNALYLLYNLTGSLAGLRGTLFLRPAEVAPDGKTKTVYVPDLRFDDYTPAQIMAGEGRAQIAASPLRELPGLPPVEDDLDDDGDHVDSDEPPVDVEIEHPPAPPDETLLAAIKRQIHAKLPPDQAAYVLVNYGGTVGPAAAKIADLHGEDARDLPTCLAALIAAGSSSDDAEHVNDDDVEIVGAET